MHATLRSTEAELDLPYIVSLVPFPDRPVQFLDDLARSVVGPQFREAAPASGGHEGSAAGDGHDDESGAGAEDDETSMSDDRQTPEVNRDDGSKADDSGDSDCDTSLTTVGDTEDDEDASGRHSGALPTPMVALSTSGLQSTQGGPTVTREDVEGMLLDQRILFEMRLRTVKLEIIQHVTEEVARRRDFISTLVTPSGGTSTFAAAPVVNEPNIWDDPHEVISTKKQPKGSKPGFMPEGATVETITPIPYDVVNDLKGGYEIT
ncbi:60S ribosomal L21 [Olea europaea subsp. europaea]|uniref:60S ribosomal L21 n=1 Tax=Olea europaea subsp. europaea TaxID=158383 RepID=A0A8S0RF45_OLEEU|nr:60S ribosomal L21 [Olea europaea subsp. europaea]